MNRRNAITNGWAWGHLDDVCTFFQGYGFPKDLQGQTTGEYPFYKVGDISRNVKEGNNYLEFCDNYIDKNILKKLKAKVSPKNTIVFAKIGEALKLNRRALIKQPGIVDNNAIGLKADGNICYDFFLFYFLNCLKLEKYSRATTVPSVRKTDIETVEIPIPPLPEQHRIVAKIEELFSELDKGVESLKTAQQQLKVYRHAVLKWAFEGKLTEEWRKQQKNLPTAAQLLEQIKSEREKQAKATGKKQKPSAQLTEEELAELPMLPGGWGWVRMAAIADACLGKMLDAGKNKGTPKPYLRNSNVRWGAFDLSDLQEMKFEDGEDERYGVKEGDLIVCEGGEPGRAAIWNEQIPDMKIQKALHRVRFSKLALSKYVLFFLVLSSKNGHLDRYFTGTTIKHLPGEKLAIFPLPLCSVDEQRRAVQEIESRLSVADKIEETIAQSLKQAEALRQSILKKAFEGKLVPQDPNDEPAEELIARIRAEKAAWAPVKGTVKGKGRGKKASSSPTAAACKP